jgi:hypothetical protein
MTNPYSAFAWLFYFGTNSQGFAPAMCYQKWLKLIQGEIEKQ